jgi:3',5'-cyclic AMP phosphodiesterase CpdA
MRRIVHLSDIHFGRVDHDVVARVVEKISDLEPNVVVVSGDLTQRARSREFLDARKFLDELPRPQIVVPGNHDVPLYNVLDRFARPLEKFKRYITAELAPAYVDGELAVFGVNTARSLTLKGGRINERQIDHIKKAMCVLSDELLKVVVTHHPFDLPEGSGEKGIVGRARLAMPTLSDCGADVFLAGHLHISQITSTAKRYRLENGRSALVIQAGTATSVRGRGEAHSFNVIEFEKPFLSVHRLECALPGKGFFVAETRKFVQSETGWNSAVA